MNAVIPYKDLETNGIFLTSELKNSAVYENLMFKIFGQIFAL